MKTNAKSFRPMSRFGIWINRQPYGVISATTMRKAEQAFHTLTAKRFQKPENLLEIRRIWE